MTRFSFLNDMLEYQEKEYKPNQSDGTYERHYNSDSFRSDISDFKLFYWKSIILSIFN